MSKKFLMKGNEALAEAAIRSGCRHFFGYPITPQTEISAYMAKRMPQIGGTFLQAESEIAAINMVLGAASAGVRAMTSSSSPGISLKSEGISYLAGSDVPAVIVNVMRGGPGLGGIQPSQADYWQATKAVGHGDFHVLVYAPSGVQEMAELVQLAFDKADQYRIPAMILADGLLGQMMEPVTFSEEHTQSLPQKPWATCGTQGKRIPNIINSLYLQTEELEQIVKNRFERYEVIKQQETLAEEYLTEDADLVVVAYGAVARIARSAIRAAREQGIKAGLIRPITLWPFPTQLIANTAKRVPNLLVAEMSMGQMVDDVRLAVLGSSNVHFYGRTGGMVPSPNEIFEQIKTIAKQKEV